MGWGVLVDSAGRESDQDSDIQGRRRRRIDLLLPLQAGRDRGQLLCQKVLSKLVPRRYSPKGAGYVNLTLLMFTCVVLHVHVGSLRTLVKVCCCSKTLQPQGCGVPLLLMLTCVVRHLDADGSHLSFFIYMSELGISRGS